MVIKYDDIQYIINEVSNRLLSEISVKDAYNRFYKDINEIDYHTIIHALQDNNDILLPETKWALNLYKRKSPRFMEDLYKLHNNNGTGYLDIFKRAKERRMINGQQGDINKYRSISELGKFVSELNQEEILGKTKGEVSNAVNSAKDQVKVVFENDRWLIVIPLTYEASCYWGNGTEWCTATRERDTYYKQYSSQGPLYININKQTGEKYQFHFESNSFMDQYDEEIRKPIFDDLGPDIEQVYRKILGQNQFLSCVYESLNAPENNRFEKANYDLGDPEEDNVFFIIDENEKVLAGPFGYIIGYKNTNYCNVYDVRNGEYALVDINGNIVLNKWWHGISYYNNDMFAAATIKETSDYGFKEIHYIYDYDGNYIINKPFKRVFGLNHGWLLAADFYGVYNYINAKGETLSKLGYEDAQNFDSKLPFAFVKKLGSPYWQLIDTTGKIILPDNFERTYRIWGGMRDLLFSRVEKDDTHINFITTEGKLLCKEWFVLKHRGEMFLFDNLKKNEDGTWDGEIIEGPTFHIDINGNIIYN